VRAHRNGGVYIASIIIYLKNDLRSSIRGIPDYPKPGIMSATYYAARQRARVSPGGR
jgi:hypothetical protein